MVEYEQHENLKQKHKLEPAPLRRSQRLRQKTKDARGKIDVDATEINLEEKAHDEAKDENSLRSLQLPNSRMNQVVDNVEKYTILYIVTDIELSKCVKFWIQFPKGKKLLMTNVVEREFSVIFFIKISCNLLSSTPLGYEHHVSYLEEYRERKVGKFVIDRSKEKNIFFVKVKHFYEGWSLISWIWSDNSVHIKTLVNSVISMVVSKSIGIMLARKIMSYFRDRTKRMMWFNNLDRIVSQFEKESSVTNFWVLLFVEDEIFYQDLSIDFQLLSLICPDSVSFAQSDLFNAYEFTPYIAATVEYFAYKSIVLQDSLWLPLVAFLLTLRSETDFRNSRRLNGVASFAYDTRFDNTAKSIENCTSLWVERVRSWGENDVEMHDMVYFIGLWLHSNDYSCHKFLTSKPVWELICLWTCILQNHQKLLLLESNTVIDIFLKKAESLIEGMNFPEDEFNFVDFILGHKNMINLVQICFHNPEKSSKIQAIECFLILVNRNFKSLLKRIQTRKILMSHMCKVMKAEERREHFIFLCRYIQFNGDEVGQGNDERYTYQSIKDMILSVHADCLEFMDACSRLTVLRDHYLKDFDDCELDPSFNRCLEFFQPQSWNNKCVCDVVGATECREVMNHSVSITALCYYKGSHIFYKVWLDELRIICHRKYQDGLIKLEDLVPVNNQQSATTLLDFVVKKFSNIKCRVICDEYSVQDFCEHFINNSKCSSALFQKESLFLGPKKFLTVEENLNKFLNFVNYSNFLHNSKVIYDNINLITGNTADKDRHDQTYSYSKTQWSSINFKNINEAMERIRIRVLSPHLSAWIKNFSEQGQVVLEHMLTKEYFQDDRQFNSLLELLLSNPRDGLSGYMAAALSNLRNTIVVLVRPMIPVSLSEFINRLCTIPESQLIIQDLTEVIASIELVNTIHSGLSDDTFNKDISLMNKIISVRFYEPTWKVLMCSSTLSSRALISFIGKNSRDFSFEDLENLRDRLFLYSISRKSVSMELQIQDLSSKIDTILLIARYYSLLFVHGKYSFCRDSYFPRPLAECCKKSPATTKLKFTLEFKLDLSKFQEYAHTLREELLVHTQEISELREKYGSLNYLEIDHVRLFVRLMKEAVDKNDGNVDSQLVAICRYLICDFDFAAWEGIVACWIEEMQTPLLKVSLKSTSSSKNWKYANESDSLAFLLEPSLHSNVEMLGKFLNCYVLPHTCLHFTSMKFDRVNSTIMLGELNALFSKISNYPRNLVQLYLEQQMIMGQNQILFCTMYSTFETIQCFLHRCITKDSRGMYILHCLVNVNQLALEIQERLITHLCNIVIPRVCGFKLVILCEDVPCLIGDFLQKWKRNVTYFPSVTTSQYYSSLFCSKDGLTRVKPLLIVLQSVIHCSGRTFIAKNWATENSYSLCSLLIYSDIERDSLIEHLCYHRYKANESKSRLCLHISISATCPIWIDYFLFELLVIRCVKSASGFWFSLENTDAVFVEPPVDTSRDRFWFLKEEGIFKLHVDNTSNPLSIDISSDFGKKAQFVLKYLLALDRGVLSGQESVEDFNPLYEPNLSLEIGEKLLQDYNIDLENKAHVTSFIRYLFDQFKQVDENIFLKNKYPPWQPSQYQNVDFVKNVVVRNIIESAKDFALPSDSHIPVKQNHVAGMIHFGIIDRWDSLCRPLILLNQSNAYESGGAGDLSLICRSENNLKGADIPLWKEIGFQFLNFENNSSNHDLCVLLLKSIFGEPVNEDFHYRVLNSLSYGDFTLTWDNILKMVSLYMRIKSGISVLITGENGCGKTFLVGYLASFLGITLVQCDVHGGFSYHDVITFVEKAAKQAKVEYPYPIWLFFDEINASTCVDLFKELVCDHSCLGRRMEENIVVIAACNPIRYEDSSLRENYRAGLEYNFPVETKVSSSNLKLVYRVNELPPSFVSYMWNFGTLTEEDELLYIRDMTRKKIDDEDVRAKLEKAIAFSHCFLRSQYRDVSVVSLRDVKRCLVFFKWFCKSYNADIAAVLSIAQTYYFRLQQSRLEFEKPINKIYFGESTTQTYSGVLLSAMEKMISSQDIPVGIALNQALLENVFVLINCIQNYVPLIIVGEPGCSKTLSTTMVLSNNILTKKNGIKPMIPFSFQCSRLSTSEGIKGCFTEAINFGEIDVGGSIPVVLLDEIGLAERSSSNCLKVLHQYLENPSIGFVGLSNWKLDAAKMNRVVYHNCPVLENTGLKQTAHKMIENSRTNVGWKWKNIVNDVTDSYLNLVASQPYRDFFGLRDFYGTIQNISRKRINNWNIFYSFQRNFGGLRPNDQSLFFQNALVDRYFDKQQIKSFVSLVFDNINDFEKENFGTAPREHNLKSRHVMLLVPDSFAWLNILFLGKKFSVIIRSEFEGDNNAFHLYQRICKFRNCMTTGEAVILLGCEDMHESLYSFLNQQYTYTATRKYCRIVLGSESMRTHVHEEFKCIIVVNAEFAYENRIPAPLLSRFEKHYVTRDAWLNLHCKEHRTSTLQNCLEVVKAGFTSSSLQCIQKAFCGYSEETILSAYMVVQNTPELAEKFIFWNATPESICKAYKSNPLKYLHLMNEYFCVQIHYHLPMYIRFVRENQDAQCINLWISTYSTEISVDMLRKLLCNDGISAEVFSLRNFNHQNEFEKCIDDFFADNAEKDVFVLTCRSHEMSCDHIANVKYLIEQVNKRYAGVNKLVAVIIFLRRQNAVKIPLIFSNSWNSLFMDSIVLEQKIVRENMFSILNEPLAKVCIQYFEHIFRSESRRALAILKYPANINVINVLYNIWELLKESRFRKYIKSRFESISVYNNCSISDLLFKNGKMAGFVPSVKFELFGSFYDHVLDVVGNYVHNVLSMIFAGIDVNSNIKLSKSASKKELWFELLEFTGATVSAQVTCSKRIFVTSVFESTFPFSNYVFGSVEKSIEVVLKRKRLTNEFSNILKVKDMMSILKPSNADEADISCKFGLPVKTLSNYIGASPKILICYARDALLISNFMESESEILPQISRLIISIAEVLQSAKYKSQFLMYKLVDINVSVRMYGNFVKHLAGLMEYCKGCSIISNIESCSSTSLNKIVSHCLEFLVDPSLVNTVYKELHAIKCFMDVIIEGMVSLSNLRGENPIAIKNNVTKHWDQLQTQCMLYQIVIAPLPSPEKYLNLVGHIGTQYNTTDISILKLMTNLLFSVFKKIYERRSGAQDSIILSCKSFILKFMIQNLISSSFDTKLLEFCLRFLFFDAALSNNLECTLALFTKDLCKKESFVRFLCRIQLLITPNNKSMVLNKILSFQLNGSHFQEALNKILCSTGIEVHAVVLQALEKCSSNYDYMRDRFNTFILSSRNNKYKASILFLEVVVYLKKIVNECVACKLKMDTEQKKVSFMKLKHIVEFTAGHWLHLGLLFFLSKSLLNSLGIEYCCTTLLQQHHIRELFYSIDNISQRTESIFYFLLDQQRGDILDCTAFLGNDYFELKKYVSSIQYEGIVKPLASCSDPIVTTVALLSIVQKNVKLSSNTIVELLESVKQLHPQLHLYLSTVLCENDEVIAELDPSMIVLFGHWLSVLTDLPKHSSFFGLLFDNPASFLTGYILGMPVDSYLAIKAAVSQLKEWTCPNGHPFFIGECGRPTQQTKCPVCSHPIGGVGHVPVSNNQMEQSRNVIDNKSLRGYPLDIEIPENDQRDYLEEVRQLRPLAVHVIRLLVNGALFVCSTTGGFDSVCTLLYKPVSSYVKTVKSLYSVCIHHVHTIELLLNINWENALAFMHAVIHQVYLEVQVNGNKVSSIVNEKERNDEEIWISRCIDAVAHRLDAVIETARNGEFSFRVFEEIDEKIDLTSVEGVRYKEKVLPWLWFCSPDNSIQHLKINYFTMKDIQKQYPISFFIFENLDKFYLASNLGHLIQWHKKIWKLFNFQLSRNKFKKYSIQDLLSTSDIIDASECRLIQNIWNTLSIQSSKGMIELRYECRKIFIPFLSENTNDVKIANLFADSREEGRIMYSILDLLVNIHNQLIFELQSLKSSPLFSTSRVALLTDTTSKDLLRFDEEKINELVGKHTYYPTSYGADSKKDTKYDLNELEDSFCDLLQKCCQVEMKLPRLEFVGEMQKWVQMRKISLNVQQVEIDVVTANLLREKLTSFQILHDASRVVEELMCFILSSQRKNLYDFACIDLDMSKSETQFLEGLSLGPVHLASLSRIIEDTIFNFSSEEVPACVLVEYRKELSDEDTNKFQSLELLTYREKRCLLKCWWNFLNDNGSTLYDLTCSLKYFLGNMEDDANESTTLLEDCDWFKHFPDDVALEKCAAGYAFFKSMT